MILPVYADVNWKTESLQFVMTIYVPDEIRALELLLSDLADVRNRDKGDSLVTHSSDGESGDVFFCVPRPRRVGQ